MLFRWTMTDYLMDKDLPQDEVCYQLLSYFLGKYATFRSFGSPNVRDMISDSDACFLSLPPPPPPPPFPRS